MASGVVFLSWRGSAVIKGAALLLAEILPVPVWALIWLVAIIVGLTVFIGGLRGVLYTEAMQGDFKPAAYAGDAGFDSVLFQVAAQ